jgi:hypothetical protein
MGESKIKIINRKQFVTSGIAKKNYITTSLLDAKLIKIRLG